MAERIELKKKKYKIEVIVKRKNAEHGGKNIDSNVSEEYGMKAKLEEAVISFIKNANRN